MHGGAYDENDLKHPRASAQRSDARVASGNEDDGHYIGASGVDPPVQSGAPSGTPRPDRARCRYTEIPATVSRESAGWRLGGYFRLDQLF